MISKLFITFCVAMLPILELRGAIPIGVGYGLDLRAVVVVSIIGNMIPVPFIIVFIEKIFLIMRTMSPILDEKALVLEQKRSESTFFTRIYYRIAVWTLRIVSKVSFKFDKIVSKLEARAEKKADVVRKYEFWGLVILVAIPLPGTGAWTGSLVAAMLNMKLKDAVPAVFLGVLIAGFVVTWITYGVSAFY